MPDSLRAAVVDAMAGGSDVHPAIRELAGLYLDRCLDALADRADEARNEVYELWAAAPGESGDMLTDLIAVLRGDT